MDAAIFYLVVSLGAATPLPGNFIGPLTGEECVRAAGAMPARVAVACRKAVALMLCAAPGQPGSAYACPIFEGDPGFVSTHRSD